MSEFIKDLWDSIFTPGTTPTLVKATHYSFIALTVTLLVLCFTTFNKHFFFMTAIDLGLWAGITWFIGELEQMKAELAAKKAAEEEAKEGEEDIEEEGEESEEKPAEPKTETEKKEE
ncbi:ER protein Pkr1-domain-containing protein [Limtongia smithiae]|uniref:ER protein Pkr1-domain-containing protein n=1 Tax=Limtongia smithiae TaxID=1125753 RepID=UPI0034CE3219